MTELIPIYPMGAKKVKPHKLEKLWNDPNQVAEIKYDGYRYFGHIGDTGNRFTSRNTSVHTGLPTEKTDRIPHLANYKLPTLYGSILDGEIISSTNNWHDTNSVMGSLPERAQEVQAEIGQIRYHVWDIVRLNGQMMDGYPQYARRKVLEEQFIKAGLIQTCPDCEGKG